jgi:hypothetical protein
MNSSVLTNLITKMIIQFHLPQETWWAIGFVVTASMLIGLWSQSQALKEWRRPTLILVCLSPAFVISMTTIGHYDLISISGMLLVVSTRKQHWILIGAMLAVVGNPEQSLVAAIALAVLVWGLGYDRFKRSSVTYIGVAVIGFVSTQIWQRASGSTGTRLFLLTDNLGDSLHKFFAIWPLAIYSWLGPLWIIVVIAVVGLNKRQAVFATVAVIAIPAIASIVTTDGTRVFVVTGLASLIVLTKFAFETRWSRTPPSAALLGLLVVALLIFPATNGFPRGELLRLPYLVLMEKFLGQSLN